MVDKNYLIETLVYHERFKPFNHRFFYKTFALKFPIEKLDELRGPLFSIGRFNLFSFHPKDYLDGSQRSLREKIMEVVEPEGIKGRGGVVLQTTPRMLGYGFNPVSFWYVYDLDQKLEAVLAEVNNTFGDRHYYLMQGFEEYKKITMKKVFHVSPFFERIGVYEFSFAPKNVIINYFDPESSDYFFRSSLKQTKEYHFSTSNLLKLFFRYPFMTFFVTARIHWQALKLFLKKAKIISRPVPPENMLSKILSKESAR